MNVKCIYCGKEFDAVRSSAKYCSDACRYAYNRERQRVESLGASVLSSLDELYGLAMGFKEFQPLVDKQLTAINNQCAALASQRVWKCATKDCGQLKIDTVKPEKRCEHCNQYDWQFAHYLVERK